ncbi:hypothetical protein GCM10022243_22760 [Saccharothrix violaceirubra]|uniref:Uncharacterized protein n=1 Tax=Saccharothrix violaceirubra TaxID=413306 RepID=A0A7W7WVR3_9PSEU|nr:hypothetical protein [Saccharothrix violaceirubra]MBB4964788.1 hypothetical protein [Saccharothrix violaceirubra]
MEADTPRARQWSIPLVILSAVFLGVATWNGILVVHEPVAWRGVAAGACFLAAISLLSAAVSERRR